MPNGRDRIHAALRDLALATVPVVGAFLCVLLWPARAGLQSNSAALAALIQRANRSLDGVDRMMAAGSATLAAVNAPCTGFHGSVSCGALAQLSQTEKNIGILAGQGAAQVRQSGQLIEATAENINMVGSHLGGAVDKLGGTAQAATLTIDASRSLILDRQPQIDIMLAHLDTIGGSAERSLSLVNDRLADPNVALLLQRGAEITGTGAHMLQTADQVETKLASCTLHPTFVCHAKAYTLFGAQTGAYLLQALPK